MWKLYFYFTIGHYVTKNVTERAEFSAHWFTAGFPGENLWKDNNGDLKKKERKKKRGNKNILGYFWQL